MMPSILNYIQNLQANSQAQGAQDPYAQAPSQPQQAPQMPQQNMPQQTPQAQYNPFNSGIKNAIEAARESLGMTNKQQEKSFNKGLINFATNFSQQPVRKGFFNNFGAASRSMLPALSEYSGAEEQYENQNNALANQILDRQAAEQQRLAQEEQQLWSRQMQEDQLNETRRYHDLTNNNRMQRSNNASGGSDISDFEGNQYRKLDKVEQRQANALKKKAGNTLLAVKEINDAFDKLENITQDNTFQPIGGLSRVTNVAKDSMGQIFGGKSLKEETAARKDLSAKLGNLTAVLEAVKAGGGKLGQGMYDRLKPNFPDLKNDDLETIKIKMDSINKEIGLYYKAAQISADKGIAIDPYDIYEMENSIPQDLNTNKPQEYTKIIDPDTGKIEEVLNTDLNEALNRGWEIAR